MDERLSMGPGIEILACGFRRLARWHFDQLAFPYWRLYWNRQPGARVILRGDAYPLDPGHFVVVSPGAAVDHRLDGRVDHFFMHVTTGYPCDQVGAAVFRLSAAGAPLQLVDELRAAPEGRGLENWNLREMDPRRAFQARALTAFVLGLIPADDWPPATVRPSLRAALEAVSAHPGGDHSVAALAARLRVGRNTLGRWFHQAVGMPPHEFVAACRLRRACVLLHHTALSIDQIAEECGFCDRYYFTRVFRRRMRVGPARYRRLMAIHLVGGPAASLPLPEGR